MVPPRRSRTLNDVTMQFPRSDVGASIDPAPAGVSNRRPLSLRFKIFDRSYCTAFEVRVQLPARPDVQQEADPIVGRDPGTKGVEMPRAKLREALLIQGRSHAPTSASWSDSDENNPWTFGIPRHRTTPGFQQIGTVRRPYRHFLRSLAMDSSQPQPRQSHVRRKHGVTIDPRAA
jgi:hypothetical protein